MAPEQRPAISHDNLVLSTGYWFDTLKGNYRPMESLLYSTTQLFCYQRPQLSSHFYYQIQPGFTDYHVVGEFLEMSFVNLLECYQVPDAE